MKKSIFILFFFITYFCNAQSKNIFFEKLDSVVVKSYRFYDKETSIINDTIQKNRMELLTSRKIKKTEIDILNRKLKSAKSYSKKRALLSDFNIRILFYSNNNIVQNIIFSSLTKNITIYKYNSCVFTGQASPYLGKEINKKLK